MKRYSILIMILILTGGMANSCLTKKQHAENNSPEWIKSTDPKTGHEVWQITSHDSISEALYFYAPSFTADDKYVIFRSKRSGNWEMYRCNLSNGIITQLTYEKVNNACIHPDGENMVYIVDWQLFKSNVHTLKKELLMDFTGKLPSKPEFRPTFTNDGKYTLVFTRLNNLNRLYRVNLETQDVLLVLEKEGGSFSHQLINPVDPDLITYVPLPDNQNDMSLPMQDRPRTRLIRLDTETNEPYLITPYGFRATHDSWSPLGDRFFFFEKTVPGWTPVSIASIDLNGKDYTRHYTDSINKLGHGTLSTNGKWFVSDGQESNTNPLILMNLADGKTKILCWPDASVNTPARVHVHPNFSLSGNYIIYTSDIKKTDTHQVFIVPIKHIKENW